MNWDGSPTLHELALEGRIRRDEEREALIGALALALPYVDDAEVAGDCQAVLERALRGYWRDV